jgi:hypothetical protein
MLRSACFAIVATVFVFMQSPVFAQSCQPTPNDTAIWSAIKDSQNALDFAQYLKDFPQGCNRVVALFKLRQMVPESIALTARIRVAGDGAWYQAPNGGFLTHGDNVVQSMTIGFDNNMDPAKLSFAYTCDAAGKGVTRASNAQECPTNGQAPIQGFGVFVSGSYSQFYTLSTECTVRRGDHSTYHPKSADGSWCGAHSPAPSEYIVNIMVTVKRQELN